MRLTHLVLAMAPLAAGAQQWAPLADLAGPARDDAAAFALGSEVFVGTGMDAGFQLRSDWYRYTTWDDSWSAIDPLPADGRQYAVAFALDGMGYVQGGLTSAGPTSQLWTYDPVLQNWYARLPMPGAARYASACFVLNGLAYVVGGLFQNGTTTDQMWAYDPVSNAWIARAPLPGGGRHRAMAFSANGRGHVFGGADAQFNALQDGWSYDPLNNTWSPADSLPEPRYAGDAVDLADGGLVIGGASNGTTAHADVWRYSVWDDAWSALPDLPDGVRRGGCVAGWGGTRVYYGTGSDNTVRYNDWYSLDLPVGMRGTEPTEGPLLWPVPATDVLHVNLPHAASPGPMELELRDAQGRLVIVRQGFAGGPLDLEGLSPGTFVLVIRQHAQRWTSRMVKLP
ncbi:MAG: hypothetical protein JNL05_12185 [Flavobacteriales bacterium]|nr:hypothetical protein [Flavobacteriales bacterium]